MLSESAIKRDQHFLQRQQLATSALAALGSAIKDIAEEEDGIDIAGFVEKLNDAAKLMNHLAFEETESRKAFILPMVDNQCKSLLKESETDEFLFGRNLGTRIKEVKSIDKPPDEKTGIRTCRQQKSAGPAEKQILLQKQAAAFQPTGSESREIQIQELEDVHINVGKIAGRLKYFTKNWQKITKSKFVLEAIKGYKIRFSKIPHQEKAPKVRFDSIKEIENYKQVVKDLMNKGLNSCAIQEFAKLIGSFVLACQAVEYGMLYTKIMEKEKLRALLNNGYDYGKIMEIPNSIRADLIWWQEKLGTIVNPIKTGKFKVEIYTDASDSGWGALSNKDHVRGDWTVEDIKHSINYRELLAVKLGLAQLADNEKDCQILLRIDNSSAIAYINKMGGVKYGKYHKLTKEIWQWAEARHIFLYADYITSADNKNADWLSRLENEDTEWELSNKAFAKIVKNFGTPDIDLFANKYNTKCKKFFFVDAGQGS
ncbi:uncharacterized protein [Prorops nasuta]|uniref:uncharacterized protein n=1 Tax=Prorops nasuta TaxID=863751 RepID=UPI0034CD3A15